MPRRALEELERLLVRVDLSRGSTVFRESRSSRAIALIFSTKCERRTFAIVSTEIIPPHLPPCRRTHNGNFNRTLATA